MLIAYKLNVTRDRNGTFLAEVTDIPEVLTNGRTAEDAAASAQDALVVALTDYIEAGRDIPHPSRPRRGQQLVPLPAMVAAKVTIYQAMRDRKMTQLALADRLKVDARQVRRLLDLDHNSTLPQIAAALAALGKQLILEIRDAA